jgi:hypothetical protein
VNDKEKEGARGSSLTIIHIARSRGKAKRSGEAERSGEGGFGGIPRRLYNTTRPRAQQDKRNGEKKILQLQCNTTRSGSESDFKQPQKVQL